MSIASNLHSPRTQPTYIYIIYTPKLGLEIAVSVQEREQGCFRGSSEGVRGSTEGAGESTEGAGGSTEGAEGAKRAGGEGSKGRSTEGPELAASLPAIAARIICNSSSLLPGSAYCYLDSQGCSFPYTYLCIP